MNDLPISLFNEAAYISTSSIDIEKLFSALLENKDKLPKLVKGLQIGFPDRSNPMVQGDLSNYKKTLEEAGITKERMELWMWKIESGSFEHIAALLLLLLPQLTTVTLHASRNASRHITPIWFYSVLPVPDPRDPWRTFQMPFLGQVQSLTITGLTGVTLENVAALFALPALDSLAISRVSDCLQDLPPAAFEPNSSKVSDLTSKLASISTKSLCRIINATTKLKRFLCTSEYPLDIMAINSALGPTAAISRYRSKYTISFGLKP
ncbi:hypothetical protein DM02DRAFT_628886 [Periconia macrospinosa]|uniref:Uncharacterized protein n=1 Tax=Periconia macrospinosa TaxID=97972 RepID=A0A2V1DPB4_9PLEO|nr:hypothetical protein DM02DRAFT_628886 [Periconia macrospinosa]